MFRIVLLCVILVFAAQSAYADGVDEVRVKTLCKTIQPHTPAHGFAGADYVPGVDVHGKTVAPADLSGGIPAMNPVVVPIELDLAQRFGLALPAGVEMKPEIARIEIFQDGRILYNGADISQRIHSTCEQVSNSEKPDGQEVAHDLVLPDTPDNAGQDVIEGKYPESQSGAQTDKSE